MSLCDGGKCHIVMVANVIHSRVDTAAK